MSYKDPTKQKEFQRLWRRNRSLVIRNKVLEMFGNRCQSCSYSNKRALQIDHIKPQLNSCSSGSVLYAKIANGSLPKEGLQLLCANCHAIKTYDDRLEFGNYVK